MGPTNSQGDQGATEAMTADQLDQLEQSDRLGGAGTLLGADESINAVDGTDQNELERRMSQRSDTMSDTTNDTNTSSGGDSNSPDDAQVQEALDPNGTGNGMGNGAMAKDPVCGVMVEISTAQNTLSADVGTRTGTLYFDSPECKALYEANPEQYAANV